MYHCHAYKLTDTEVIVLTEAKLANRH